MTTTTAVLRRATPRRAVAVAIAALAAGGAGCGADAPAPTGAGASPVDWAAVEADLEGLIARGDVLTALARVESTGTDAAPPPRVELLFATALHGAKRYGAAEPRFAHALAAEPPPEGFAGGVHLHAWCLFQLGRLDEARARFLEHAALDPTEGDTPLGLGRIALADGRLADAREALERSVALHRAASESGRADRRAEGARALAFLGDVHLAEGDPAAARAALEASVTSYPFHLGAWSKLHAVCLELGDDAGAAKALEGRAHFEALRDEAAVDGATNDAATGGERP